MKRRRSWFNLYFALALATGCGGFHPFAHKQAATVRLYVESTHASDTGTALVTRDKIPMSIEREPFLDESDLAKAQLVDNPDGTFSIDLIFDEHGGLLLDMTTVANMGRRIVVFSHFPPPGTKEDTGSTAPEPEKAGKPRKSGWISAVMIRQRISNGAFRFTPDTTREEAQRIVTGLNNVVEEAKKSF